jgi:hypothetical protein
VVTETYVAESTSWNGAYWSFWSRSAPYSPLVLIYDSYGDLLFKQFEVNYISTIGQCQFQDGQAWIWLDTNGDLKYDSGDSMLHFRQQQGGTCGEYTVMNIVESVKGVQSSYPATTLQWFSDQDNWNPPYNPSMNLNIYDPSPSYGATYPTEWLTYLETQGFTGSMNTSTDFSSLVSAINNGKIVQVGLDADYMWAEFFPKYARDIDGYVDAAYADLRPSQTGGGHSVWLMGFQYDSSGNITNAIIMDSGLGGANAGGSFSVVPIQAFENAVNAWIKETNNEDGAGCSVIYSPPSGYSWSNAGIDTWASNPDVWSTTW